MANWCIIDKLRFRRRGVAQFGSAPALGAGCRRFESCHPDHLFALPSIFRRKLRKLGYTSESQQRLWGAHMRVWFNGRTSAFQADNAGSIPVTRSRKLFNSVILAELFCFQQRTGNRSVEVERRQENASGAFLGFRPQALAPRGRALRKARRGIPVTRSRKPSDKMRQGAGLGVPVRQRTRLPPHFPTSRLPVSGRRCREGCDNARRSQGRSRR